MNKVYRVIYNKSTNQTMVVSEITKSHTKSGSSLTDKRSGNVSGCLKSMDLKKSAIIVAMVSLFTPLSVFAATPDGVATPAGLVTTGNPSVQLGSESGVTGSATNHPSVANGGNEVKDKTSSVWGTKNSSNGSYSTVWGQGNTATGTNATAFGSGSTASGSNATAWSGGYAGAVQGTDTVNYTISSNNYPADENGNRPTFTITKTVTGNGANATAWGGGRAIGNNSTAIAQGKAYGSASMAIGNGAIAYGSNSIAFGQGKAIGSDSIAFGRATAEGNNSFANGSSKTIAIGSNSVAFGESTIAEGNNAMTWGFGTKTAGNNATAFGKWTVASGERATAFGMQTQALGDNSVAAGGLDNVVNANNAAALGGQNAVVSGLNSVTLGGDGSQALANNSLAAVGGVVSAGAENAIAMGDQANATLEDSVALGSGSTTTAGVPVESAGEIGGATYTNHTWSNKLADANKVVSVGNRQIQHIANGQVSASSTDAINGSQLYAAYQDLQWKASVSSSSDGGTVSGAVAEQVIGDYTGSLNKGVVNFKAGKGIEIETANNGSLDMTFKVDKAKDHKATNGKIVAGSPADKYWDNVQVTNAINDSGWKLGNSSEIINPGDTVNFNGQNGITVNATGGNVTIGFDKEIPNYEAGNNISFQNVTDNEGNITSTKINARDTTIQAASGNQHLTVSGGTLNDAGVREYTIQSNIKGDNKNISVANDGTISFTDTTTYTSEVNGLGLAKTGDEVKLTGVLPTSKVQAGTNITSVSSATDTATGVTTYTVNATGVAHDSTNKYIKVTGGNKENFVVNEEGLDDAIKAAKSEVVAGKGGVSVAPVSQNTDGANVYTVNAIDTQINPTGKYTSVAGGEVDANGVRMYTINSTLQGGKDIEIGADGKINYTGTDNDTKTTVTTTDSNLKVTPKIDGENREYDIALNKNLDLSDSGSLKTGNTLINNDGVTAKNITGDTVNATTLNAGDGNVFNVSGSTATYNTTVSGDNGKEVANVEYVNKVQTIVEQGKNTVVTGNKNSNGGMTYTVDAYDTKVKAGSGLKLTQNGDTADSNNVRTYELALSDENQNAINNAMSSLTTAVDGTTAQTLNNSSNQANFMTGDNIQLSGDANGITIATKKDVTFNKVMTGSLKADTAELGATTITGDSTYKGSEIVNKTYADSLGWDLKVNGKKQGDRIVNNGSVNIANGQNTTVEYADGAVKINAKDTQLTAGDYIQLNNGDADANGVRHYTVSAKTTALTTENGKVKTPSGSDLVSADNMANTLNNLYWTAEATEKANVKAGDTVKFQGEKGIAVSNNGQTFTITNNAKYESEVAGLTLTKDDTTGDVKLTGNVSELVDGLEPLKFAGDSGDTLQPKFGDTVKIVGDGQNISVKGANGQLNVSLNKDVVLGNDSDSGSLKVNGDAGSTAINPNEITFSQDGNINNIATHINPDGTTVSGSNNNQAASVQDVLNSGWRIKVGNADAEYVKHNEQVAFIDGKGTSVSGSKAGVAYHINTDPTSQLTINSNNQLTLNTGASSVDAGKAKAEDANSQKIATVGDMVNTINNTYWTATDGQNNTQVKAGDTLTWQGSGSLKVENENGTFTISDKTAYTSEVNGLGLSKDGDTVKLTGTLPKDTNTVTAVTTADSNLKVTPKIDGENREYDIALNKNLDLSDSGSLKVGDMLINNDGMTINNGSQGKPVTLTKNGLDNGGNKISNVATGVADTDAVNVGQLKEAMNDANININQVIYGSDTPRPELLKTYNADSDAVHKTNAVAEAIYNMNEHGIKYFHTHDGSINPAAEGIDTDDSIAKGTFSTAIGYQAKAEGESALAIGNGSAATADNSIAIGAGNNVTGEKSIAIGYGHTVSGSRSGAFGDPSIIDGDNSYAVGNDVEIAKGNKQVFVLGNNVKETHSNSVFLGDSSAYTVAGASTAGMDEYSTNAEDIMTTDGSQVAVAAGDLKFAGSKPAGVVSVGAVGEERRIQNVAAGLISEKSTDAINGSQLYSVAQQVGKVSNGGAGPVQYSNANSPTISNGGIKSNDVTLVGADSMQPVTVHNVANGHNPTDAVNVSQLQQATSNLGNRLNDRIDSVSQRSDASAASSIAVASMPQAYIPGKSLISAGGGTYHGQTGYAIGISTISDGGNWILKGTATGNSQKRYGAGVGVGYQW